MDTAQRVMLYHVLEDHHDSHWQKNTKENVYTVLKTQKYAECYESYLIYVNFIVKSEVLWDLRLPYRKIAENGNSSI